MTHGDPLVREAVAGDSGRQCPYCRFAFEAGIPVKACPECTGLHHEDCWRDNGGCAMVGCPAAPGATAEQAAALAAIATRGASASRATPADSAQPAAAGEPQRQGRLALVFGLVLALGLGAAAGAVAAASSVEPRTETVVSTETETTDAEPSADSLDYACGTLRGLLVAGIDAVDTQSPTQISDYDERVRLLIKFTERERDLASAHTELSDIADTFGADVDRLTSAAAAQESFKFKDEAVLNSACPTP